MPLQKQRNLGDIFSKSAIPALMEALRPESEEEISTAMEIAGGKQNGGLEPRRAVRRIVSFLGLIVLLAFVMNAMIIYGLRRIKTSAFGAWNLVMEGKVNADVIITGSSRASVHYDPRTIEAGTGRMAFNLGLNGSQTDMQVAFLKAYLAHNRKPEVVLHNLDAFSFVTSRKVFDPAQYSPYLYDRSLYDALRKINPGIWKSRYLPLYGYVVEDMNLTWVRGLAGFFGWSPPENYFLGFNPRHRSWTNDFQNFRTNNPHGVRFEIEPEGIRDVEDLIQVCKQNGIQLIFVYSPEYNEMQTLTNNRAEIFAQFHELASRYGIPLWDYSEWSYDGNQDFFYNSQHLNATGAAVFSADLAQRLSQYYLAKSKAAGELQALKPGSRSTAHVAQN